MKYVSNPDINLMITDVAEMKRLRREWWDIQNVLIKALQGAAKSSDQLTSEEQIKWRNSTTHQEVGGIHTLRRKICFRKFKYTQLIKT